jgi:Ras-related protein Rab-2A
MMKLSLWDTAGQETYKAVTRSYFRGASGALLVFDITRRKTFESATSWLHDLRQIAEEDIVVVLVGNKAKPNQRQVTREEAEEWCKQNKVMQYVETSAKSGEGVERAFLEVSERIYQNIESGRYDLNDKRSGVKGPGAGGGNRTVTLGGNNANGSKKGAAGGCC